MARPWRIEYEGAYYHVLSRGNEGRNIFYDEEDRRLFLDTVGEVSDRFQVDIFAYVLMSNHYHLLLRTTHANLSKVMQWLGLVYTRRFSDRHSRTGHLFQGRFKSILIEDDAYVVELSCYIHRNPLRAGIVKRLADYRWSSYPSYAYGRKGPAFLNTDFILSLFEGGNIHKAYRDKVQRYSEEEAKLWENFRHGLIMGSEQFVDRIKSRYIADRPHHDVPQQRGVVGRVDIPYVLERASEILQCDFALFRQEQRLHGYDKDCRDLLVYWFWQRGAYTNEEIGNIFGVSYSAVSHSVKKVKPRISEESELFRKYRLLNSQIKM